jgi:DNA-binding transcriptional ArsR family regulator
VDPSDPSQTCDLDIARIAALVGDPARAAMLRALGDGRALPCGELAACAGIGAASASEHLRQLREAGLLAVSRSGRHRYHRIASPEVAALLEALALVAAQGAGRPVSRVDPALRAGRTCYDHLAGRLGVAILDALAERAALWVAEDIAHLTPSGLSLLADFGLDTRALERHPVSRTCTDWSERRYHLSGPLGAAICRRCFELDWVQRHLDSRAVSVTPEGARGLRAALGLRLP